jgi:hypothetical protein
VLRTITAQKLLPGEWAMNKPRQHGSSDSLLLKGPAHIAEGPGAQSCKKAPCDRGHSGKPSRIV